MDGSPQATVAKTSFDALYQSEYIAMVQLGYLLLGSRALSEEIAQEAFLSVSRRWDSIDNPGGYLRTCVVNGCHQRNRRDQIESKHQFHGQDDVFPAELIDLHDALRRLPERQRSSVVLRYFVDCTEADMAKLLECRPATVRSLVRRGVASLRKELSE